MSTFSIPSFPVANAVCVTIRRSAAPNSASAIARAMHTSVVFLQIVRAMLALLITACGGATVVTQSQTQSPGQHILSVSVSLVNLYYVASPNALLEVQLLVDGTAVAEQQYPNGGDEADFNYYTAYNSGGTHEVSVRIVKQRYSTELYAVVGAAAAVYGSTSVGVDFRRTIR